MGPTTYYSQSQVVSTCQSFMPRAPSFFLAKLPFFGFFLIQKVMWPYRYAYGVPLVTVILNIYIFMYIYVYVFVGLARFLFLAKVPFLAFLI